MNRVKSTQRGVARLGTTAAPLPRDGAERTALEDLERWRCRAVPDATTPLDAEDLVRLLRDCVAALGLDSEIANGVSVNTIHYYRRKDIIDPPVGKTAAARYDVHHLWQVAGARLAGALGLVTLAEARDVIRGADADGSMAFLAERVADARARDVVRAATPIDEARRPLRGAVPIAAPAIVTRATVVTLPGDAWCVLPAGHAAHQSPEAARSLASALVAALEQSRSS